MIHYNYDQYETVQFNEGLSEIATIICGGEYISHAHYLNQADQIGWAWDSDAAHYAMASLFSLYFVEQLGDGAIKEFITINAGTNPLQGWQAFDQLLTKHNIGQTHKEWLVDWFTANYLDNKSMNSKYGYDLWMPMRARYTAKHLSGNVESTGNTVQDYGSNYIAYESSADSMEITFSATSGGTPYIRSIEYNDSSAVVNTLSNDAKHLVYHYKLDYDNDGIHDSLKVRSALFIGLNGSILIPYMKALSIGKTFKYLRPDLSPEEIGPRAGEKIHEAMLANQESETALCHPRCIVLPAADLPLSNEVQHYLGLIPIKESKLLSLQNNPNYSSLHSKSYTKNEFIGLVEGSMINDL